MSTPQDNNPEEDGFFTLKQFSDALKETYGPDAYYLESKGGAFPIVLVRSAIFGNRMISVPFGDYGGPVGNAEGLTLEAVQKARELDADFIEVRSPSRPLKGFERRDDYCTFVVNLELSTELLWKSLEKRTRNDINKGKRSGITIEEGSEAQIPEFFKIYLETMKRLGSPPQGINFFTSLFKHLPGRIRLVLARLEGKAIAAHIYYLSDKKIHYAYNCSVEKHRSLRATDLMLWETISWAKSQGQKEFDFGRTRPGSGVYFSKKAWGGEERKMPYYYLFLKKRIEERQETKYHLLSRAWALLMPGFIAKRIGPWIIKQVG